MNKILKSSTFPLICIFLSLLVSAFASILGVFVFYLIVGSILLSIILYSHPEWIIYILVFSLPLPAIEIPNQIYTTNLTRVSALLSVIAIVIMKGKDFNFKVRGGNIPAISIISFYIFSISLSTMVNFDKNEVLRGFLSQLVVIIIFVIITLYANTYAEIRKLINVFLLGIAFSALLGAIGYVIFTYFGIKNIFVADKANVVAIGLATNRVRLALFSVLGLFISFIFFSNRNNDNKFLYLVIGFICFLATVFSFSRSGWLSMLFGGFVLTIVQQSKRRFRFLIVMIILVTFFGFVMGPKLSSLIDLSAAANQPRIAIWNEAIRSIDGLSIIWGIGINTLDIKIYSIDPSISKYVQYHDSTHNAYLEALINRGIIGLLSVIILVAYILLCLHKINNLYLSRGLKDEVNDILRVLIIIFSVFFAESFVNTLLREPALWLGIGLTHSLYIVSLKHSSKCIVNKDVKRLYSAQ